MLKQQCKKPAKFFLHPIPEVLMRSLNRLMIATLAVAGTTAAFAQSSVQVYGRLNTSVERQKVGDVSTNGLYNNASRIGFRGTEDLGGGLKAGFVLESGFDSSTGAGNSGKGIDFKRQSELNLAGNFGMLRMGVFTAESYYAVADYGVLDQPNHDTGSLSDALYNYGMRDSNKIAYRTPVLLGGLTIEGAASFHEKAAGTNKKNGYDLAVNWEGGPLAFGGAYTQIGDDKNLGLRAHYTINAFQVGAYYQRSDEDVRGKRNAARVTGQYTMGASEFVAGFGWAGKWDNMSNSGARQLILGYNYNLSKRSKLFAGYTKVDNKANASYATGIAGADFSTFALGMRHNF